MEKEKERRITMAGASERVEMLKRANIKYFIYRNGCVENSRLIAVDYPSDVNTLLLRDVKRWIWELEGHDTLDSFTWSYKRRYKRGIYQWIDVKEDEVITPISNNDYIVRATLLQFHLLSDKAGKKPPLDQGSFTKSQHKSENIDRRLARFKIDASMGSHRKEEEGCPKRKSSTNICCNMLSCVKNDANESALLSSTKGGQSGPRGKRSAHDVPHQQRTKFKLMGAPNCTQCGRHFDPEKLNWHMHSCKGLKIREKGGRGGYRRNDKD